MWVAQLIDIEQLTRAVFAGVLQELEYLPSDSLLAIAAEVL
jgi:hypothetical protein